MNKGLKILLNTYWSSQGWKDGSISDEDFDIAKNEGYMFNYPDYAPHDEVLKHAKEIAEKIDKKDVANAFLFSLSTRKLEYRSALGSYCYIKSIPEHNHNGNSHCDICNWYGFCEDPDEYEINRGLNVLNFERYKWGGVRHDNLSYAKFDLEEFLKLPKVIPNEEDIRLLCSVLEIVKKLPLKSKAGKYIKQICTEKNLKTNKSEITIMLGILAICDVFNSSNAKGYLHCFTPADGSRDPSEHTNDISFPLNHWHVSDGINTAALHEVFGFDLGLRLNFG